jgi:hypothetical protein
MNLEVNPLLKALKAPGYASLLSVKKLSTPTLLNILTKEISSKLCSIGFTF